MSEENSMEINDTDLLITCKICGKRYRSLPVHLQTVHNLTKEEYIKLYPDSPVHSKAYHLNMSVSAKHRHQKNKNILEVKPDIPVIFEKVIVNDEDIISDIPSNKILKNTELSGTVHLPSLKTKKIVINTNKEYTVEMLRDKNILLEYFSKKYSNIVNNYLIEHFYLNGLLEYSLITDFVDLHKKIIFDFPNAFWHNVDQKFIFNKEEILTRDGWTIKRYMSFEEVLL